MRLWLAEALELSKRGVLPFLLLGLGIYGVRLIVGSGLVLLCLFPLILSLGCVIAKSTDSSNTLLKTISEVAPIAWVRVFIVWSVSLAIFALPGLVLEFTGLMQLIFPDSISSDGVLKENGSELRALIKFSILIAMFASLIAVLLWMTNFLWFFFTLCVIAELPLMESYEQASDGVLLNKFVIWPYIICVLTLLIIEVLFPPLFLLWLAVSTSMMYVSYRDVWLAKTKNSPVERIKFGFKLPAMSGQTRTSHQ